MKFSIKDFFSKCGKIRSYPRIWSHLLKKSLMENFIFCAVTLFLFKFISKNDEPKVKDVHLALHEKCSYWKFFWSVFSHIRTQLGLEKLQIRTIFTQCRILSNLHYKTFCGISQQVKAVT